MIEHESYAEGLDALWAASSQFRFWEGWREAVAAGVKLPDGVSLDSFARDPEAYRMSAEVDVQAFFAALHEKVIDPVVDTQKVIASRPYLTRLFTTMSADEMTNDPVFTYNEDLQDLDNEHVAQQYIECTPTLTEYEAPWRIVLPLGDVVRGEGRTWPVDASMVPASRAIEQLTNVGQGTVLVDNAKRIAKALEELSPPRGTGAGGEPGQDTSASAAEDDGCSVRAPGSDVQGLAPALALLTAALAFRRRRGP